MPVKMLFIFLLLMLQGCLFFQKPLVPGRLSPLFSTVKLGVSIEGRTIKSWVFPGKKPCVFILGGIHGNEPSSSDLVIELTQYLVKHPEATCGREIVIIPKANPDGLSAHTRTNSRGVDLNRNFESGNFKSGATHGLTPQSELETFVLVKALNKYNPSVVVSVHAPLDCIDPDGGKESYKLAAEMEKVSPLSVRDLDEFPGSMGSYVGGEPGVKMITYELDRKRTPLSGAAEYLSQHIEALLVAIEKG